MLACVKKFQKELLNRKADGSNILTRAFACFFFVNYITGDVGKEHQCPQRFSEWSTRGGEEI